MPAPLSDTMQQRINRLEGLVNTLLSQAQTNASPGASSLPHHALTPESEIESLNGKDDESAAPFNLGTTVIDGGHSVYRAADNWSDLLQEVNLTRSNISFLRIALSNYLLGTLIVP